MKFTLALLAIFLCSVGYSQSLCDSVQVIDVRIDPLNPELLLVDFNNQSSDIFSYPGVRVYDSDEVLIGEHEVNLFGFWGETTFHLPNELSGIVAGQDYDVTIELWTGFYSEMVCSFSGTFELVKDEECADLAFVLAHYGEDALADPFVFTITDENGIEVVNESIFLDFGPEYQSSQFCLPRGCYELVLTTTDAVISYPTSWFLNPNYEPLDNLNLSGDVDEGEVQMTMNFGVWMEECLPDNLEEKESTILIWPNPSIEIIHVKNSQAWDRYEIVDISGQFVMSGKETEHIDVYTLSTGNYILNIHSTRGVQRLRFIKE